MQYRATTFYSPSLHYYVARGWGEDAILSGVMRTHNTIRGTLTLQFGDSSSDSATSAPHTDIDKTSADHHQESSSSAATSTAHITLFDLKREVVRSLLLAYLDEHETETNSKSSVESPVLAFNAAAAGETDDAKMVDYFASVETAVDRWAALIHLKQGGKYLVEEPGRRVADGVVDHPRIGTEHGGTASQMTSVNDEPVLHVVDARRERHPTARSQQQQQQQQVSASGSPADPVAVFQRQQRESHEERQRSLAAPVLLPANARNSRSILVVSFVTYAEWRAARQAQREKKRQEASEIRDGDQAVHNREESQNDAAQADHTDAGGGTFSCSDDRRLAQWLVVKGEALQAWRSHGEKLLRAQMANGGDKAVPPSFSSSATDAVSDPARTSHLQQAAGNEKNTEKRSSSSDPDVAPPAEATPDRFHNMGFLAMKPRPPGPATGMAATIARAGTLNAKEESGLLTSSSSTAASTASDVDSDFDNGTSGGGTARRTVLVGQGAEEEQRRTILQAIAARTKR